MIKVRLVKVVVQPIFVADDGTHLSEIPVAPRDVSAKEWATYPTEGFSDAVAALEKSLNSGDSNMEAFE